MPKVFVSYSHAQREWVWGRLVPVLRAAGAEVLIDVERFKAGVSCFKQMDAEQDAADCQLLCFSEEYMQSKSCNREWKRALRRDPTFSTGHIVPIVLQAQLTLPKEFLGPNPLYVEMRNDRDKAKWQLLLRSLGINWNCCPVSWLHAAEWITRKLNDGTCVNLLVPRLADNKHRQPVTALIAHLRETALPWQLLPNLQDQDLHAGECTTLSGLLGQLLMRAGIHQKLSANKRTAIVEFTTLMRTLKAPLELALTSCDVISNQERQKAYGTNFFATLFDLTRPDKQSLRLLAISHRTYASIIPSDAYLSDINFSTIELDFT